MTQPTGDTGLESRDSGGGRDLRRDRKALSLVALAVVVVAAVGYFLVLPRISGSSADTASSAPVVHHTRTAVSPSASPSTALPATPAPPLSVRDPFAPLYVAPVAATSAAPVVAPTVAPTAPPTQTIVIAQPAPTVTTTASPRWTLVLTKVVDASHVDVTVNGRPLVLATGADFPDAKNGPFQLSTVTVGGPAGFLYGDAHFDMAVGETQYEN